jgi:thiol-disulfide isomerase/thioredoxin
MSKTLRKLVYASITIITIIAMVEGIQNHFGKTNIIQRIVGADNPFDPSIPLPNGPAEVPQVTSEVTITTYTAKWCAACHQFKPELEKLRKLGYSVTYIDVDENQENADKEKVLSLPFTKITSDTGKKVTFYGFQSSDQIIEMIKQLTSNNEPNNSEHN